eukprot:9123967-Heterocapsa_arctica.AAC.1
MAPLRGRELEAAAAGGSISAGRKSAALGISIRSPEGSPRSSLALLETKMARLSVSLTWLSEKWTRNSRLT